MITIYDPAQPQPLLLTARQGWGVNHYETRKAELGGKPATQLIYRHGDEAKPLAQSCLWLPWTSLLQVGGLTVDMFCNSSGVKFYLDCLDGDGWGLRFFLGTDQYDGWHTFRFDPFEIAATWGACAGKRSLSDPLQPVALVIEDHDNVGTFELGLGKISAHASLAEEAAPSGDAACLLSRATLELDISRGGHRLLRNFGLHGMLPGTSQPDFRRLTVRNVSAVTPGHYRAELAAGEVALPLEVELQQLSSQVWILRYELRIRSDMRLEQLDLRGLINYRDAAGLKFAAGDGERGRLDCNPRADALLADPEMWEPLFLGDSATGRLRIKADGPILKSMRLLDLRTEEDNPCYAVDVVVASNEDFGAGADLKFSMLFDGKA